MGLIDNWLRHIRDVRAANAKELDSLENIEDRTNRLAELKYEFLVRFYLITAFLRKSIP